MPDDPIPATPMRSGAPDALLTPATPVADVPPARAGWLRGLGILRWLGIALVVAGVVVAIVASRRADRVALEILALVLAGGGAAVAASAERALGWLPLCVVAGTVAAVAFAQTVAWAAWPALGACLGAALRWGYARRRRAWWFTGALLALAYLVVVAAGLLRASEGRGIAWIAAQGVGSLAVGLALRSLAPRWSASPALVAVALLAARALLIAGIALPYAALAVTALGRAA